MQHVPKCNNPLPAFECIRQFFKTSKNVKVVPLVPHLPHHLPAPRSSGIPRLIGARDKKQVWLPHVRT